jgi:hypothetical protein
MFISAVLILASLSSVVSDTPPSLCDKYTKALLTDNTAANQQLVLTLLVNTAVAGNVDFSGGKLSQTILNADVALGKKGAAKLNVTVTGILNLSGTGTYMGKTINLMQYFDGSKRTTNENNIKTKVNFLDIGFEPFINGINISVYNFFYDPFALCVYIFLILDFIYKYL